jgi:prepilin signal peptidase PulO-like enzyme (type II secretory pathway)
MLFMPIIVIFLGFILGMVVNLLADSLPRYRRLKGFHCPACEKDRDLLAWSGLLALITGRRKCPYCGNEQDWRVALVEIVLAVGAYLLYRADPTPTVFLPGLFILFIFLLIIVIDIEHRLILHVVSGTSALVIFLLSFLNPNRDILDTVLGGAAGFFGFFALYFLGHLFAMLMSRLRGSPLGEVAFGFGDVTLAGVIGLTVGWPGVVAALIVGIFLAGIFSFLIILVRILRRQYTPFMPIPYGPFMVIGCLSVYFGVVKSLALMLAG